MVPTDTLPSAHASVRRAPPAVLLVGARDARAARVASAFAAARWRIIRSAGMQLPLLERAGHPADLVVAVGDWPGRLAAIDVTGEPPESVTPVIVISDDEPPAVCLGCRSASIGSEWRAADLLDLAERLVPVRA